MCLNCTVLFFQHGSFSLSKFGFNWKWLVSDQFEDFVRCSPDHITSHSELFEVQRLLNINPLKPELNPICYLLALLGAHHFLHDREIRVKSLNFRLLMSYIYIYIYGTPILDVSRSHTTTQHSR